MKKFKQIDTIDHHLVYINIGPSWRNFTNIYWNKTADKLKQQLWIILGVGVWDEIEEFYKNE